MTGRNIKMVARAVFGAGAFAGLADILEQRRRQEAGRVVFLVDDVFHDMALAAELPVGPADQLLWLNVADEPHTGYVDHLSAVIRTFDGSTPVALVGIGGGSALDITKAVSVLLTNPGSSVQYQGWDLVGEPGVYHIGVPTLSGTGAEVSRTAVLIGPERKLGINSDFTVFDQVVLDPGLMQTVPGDQYFFTGMDCYIHAQESLQGTFINAFSRAYAEKALDLCREVFVERAFDRDEKMMMASYFGGISIAYSQVGACHALSYGLSFVLGIHHGVGNCIAFDVLEEYYPEGVAEFRDMLAVNGIELPREVVRHLGVEQLDRMVAVAGRLEPLWENCLGPEWRRRMPPEKIRELYARM